MRSMWLSADITLSAMSGSFVGERPASEGERSPTRARTQESGIARRNEPVWPDAASLARAWPAVRAGRSPKSMRTFRSHFFGNPESRGTALAPFTFVARAEVTDTRRRRRDYGSREAIDRHTAAHGRRRAAARVLDARRGAGRRGDQHRGNGDGRASDAARR